MKKKNLIMSMVALLSITSISGIIAYNSNLNLTHAANQSEAKITSVVEAINKLDEISKLGSEHRDYVYTTLYMYNNLSSDERTQISADLVNKLNNSVNTINAINKASEFDKEFNYLLNDPTFDYTSKLNELTATYNSFTDLEKSYVKDYNEENIANVKANSNLLKPDVYYDFTNATVSNSKVINQGSAANKDATVIGDVLFNANGMSFTNNASSCLKLPSDLFSGVNEFTFSFIYQKEVTDDKVELIYTIGNDAFHNSSDGRMGLRAYYATWATRGPFHQIAHKDITTSSKEIGTMPQLIAQGHDLHTYKMTIRYLSKPQHIQVYEEDLDTGMWYSFNLSGNPTTANCSDPSLVLNSSNFDFNNFTENYLGARNGYSNGGNSFKGKYLSFRYYSRLVTDREMYGSDDRLLNVGQNETLDYVNNFNQIGASFESYKAEYAKVIDNYYYKMITCPYDYQKFFDKTHVSYFMEAYNAIHS